MIYVHNLEVAFVPMHFEPLCPERDWRSEP
jgi:hypothetical protein